MRHLALLCLLSCSHTTLADDGGDGSGQPQASTVELKPVKVNLDQEDLDEAMQNIDRHEQIDQLYKIVVQAHPDIAAEVEAEAQEAQCATALTDPWMSTEHLQSCVVIARADEVDVEDTPALFAYLQLRFPDLLAIEDVGDWVEVLELGRSLLFQAEHEAAQRANDELRQKMEVDQLHTKPCPMP